MCKREDQVKIEKIISLFTPSRENLVHSSTILKIICIFIAWHAPVVLFWCVNIIISTSCAVRTGCILPSGGPTNILIPTKGGASGQLLCWFAGEISGEHYGVFFARISPLPKRTSWSNRWLQLPSSHPATLVETASTPFIAWISPRSCWSTLIHAFRIFFRRLRGSAVLLGWNGREWWYHRQKRWHDRSLQAPCGRVVEKGGRWQAVRGNLASSHQGRSWTPARAPGWVTTVADWFWSSSTARAATGWCSRRTTWDLGSSHAGSISFNGAATGIFSNEGDGARAATGRNQSWASGRGSELSGRKGRHRRRRGSSGPSVDWARASAIGKWAARWFPAGSRAFFPIRRRNRVGGAVDGSSREYQIPRRWKRCWCCRHSSKS